MPDTLHDSLIEATRLTNAGRLAEATEALQRMLGGRGRAASGGGGAGSWRHTPEARPSAQTIDGVAAAAGAAHAKATRRAGSASAGIGVGRMPFSRVAGTRPEIPEVLRDFLDHIGHGGLESPGGGLDHLSSNPASMAVPNGAQFLAASFTDEAGSRPYKLYVPSRYRPDRPVPLIVMLHGCTQSPNDFAAGTRMNDLAEENTFLVAYPGQTNSANIQRCWNWFRESDQRRNQGEPSLIAGITRQVMREYAVDPRRVYVAGLSAGGAAAAIMGEAYPDLYAAIGVHSGLACGAAHDLPSAFAAMQGKGVALRAVGAARSGAPPQRVVPAIVFHGERDTTVNPRNADKLVAQSAQDAALRADIEDGQVPGGHAYSRIRHVDAGERTVIEQWVVHGAGHAWFGGSPGGSYTDPRGPDASREMVRFFLEHPQSARAA